jgi:hypothetical protein
MGQEDYRQDAKNAKLKTRSGGDEPSSFFFRIQNSEFRISWRLGVPPRRVFNLAFKNLFFTQEAQSHP